MAKHVIERFTPERTETLGVFSDVELAAEAIQVDAETHRGPDVCGTFLAAPQFLSAARTVRDARRDWRLISGLGRSRVSAARSDGLRPRGRSKTCAAAAKAVREIASASANTRAWPAGARVSSCMSAPTSAAAGSVNSQAARMLAAMPQRTAEKRWTAPAPSTEPLIV